MATSELQWVTKGWGRGHDKRCAPARTSGSSTFLPGTELSHFVPDAASEEKGVTGTPLGGGIDEQPQRPVITGARRPADTSDIGASPEATPRGQVALPLSDRRAPAGRPRSETSSFGVSRRENHDSSRFYQGFDPPPTSDDEEVRPCSATDRLFCAHSRDMAAVADKSVALVVTSPPYHSSKEYEIPGAAGTVPGAYSEYLAMLEAVFAECRRVLEPGGRICVNVANLGRRPYRPLAAETWAILDRLGFLARGEIVWVKGRGSAGSAAFGSFAKASNPVLRDLTERILVAGKGGYGRARHPKIRRAQGLPWQSTITKEDFLAWTVDVWEIRPESARRVGHPAPFPVELSRRLIELYSYRGDVVLDCFAGAGSTAVAAVRSGRRYVGYDTDPGYLHLARRRIAQVEAALRLAPELG
jgi:modification methylase